MIMTIMCYLCRNASYSDIIIIHRYLFLNGTALTINIITGVAVSDKNIWILDVPVEAIS